jgi:hypothetical protein
MAFVMDKVTKSPYTASGTHQNIYSGVNRSGREAGKSFTPSA